MYNVAHSGRNDGICILQIQPFAVISLHKYTDLHIIVYTCMYMYMYYMCFTWKLQLYIILQSNLGNYKY